MKKFLLILLSVVCSALCIDVEAQTRRDGEFLFNEKRYEEAYGVYEKLMNRQPRDYTLKYLAGRCLFEMNRYEEASVLLESAARHDVLKANIWLYEIYFSQYRFVDAVDVLSVYMDQATLNA